MTVIAPVHACASRSSPTRKRVWGGFRLGTAVGRWAVFLCVGWVGVTLGFGQRLDSEPTPLLSYEQWQTACKRLPENRVLRGHLPDPSLLPLKTFAPLAALLDSFAELSRTGHLARVDLWQGAAPTPAFYQIQQAYFARPAAPFEPFVQREVVGAKTEVVLQGDLHGDVHSLLRRLAWLNAQGYLQGFRITRPEIRLVFLGDYTDRGVYGIEVLYTILRLKLENPEQVILVRGNHEDYRLMANYGFFQEGTSKYGRSFNPRQVARVFDFLPVALYLGQGTNFVQCNHGGVEPGFHPGALLDSPLTKRFQLLGSLRQAAFFREHPEVLKGIDRASWSEIATNFLDCVPTSPTLPTLVGFMWNDFTVTADEPGISYTDGRSAMFGEGPVKYLLEWSSGRTNRLHSIFRAHQHALVMNPMMARLLANRGLYRHWQPDVSASPGEAASSNPGSEGGVVEVRKVSPGAVWTLNVAADTPYGLRLGFEFDSFAILQIEAAFPEWRLKVVNLPSRTAAR